MRFDLLIWGSGISAKNLLVGEWYPLLFFWGNLGPIDNVLGLFHIF